MTTKILAYAYLKTSYDLMGLRNPVDALVPMMETCLQDSVGRILTPEAVAKSVAKRWGLRIPINIIIYNLRHLKQSGFIEAIKGKYQNYLILPKIKEKGSLAEYEAAKEMYYRCANKISEYLMDNPSDYFSSNVAGAEDLLKSWLDESALSFFGSGKSFAKSDLESNIIISRIIGVDDDGRDLEFAEDLAQIAIGDVLYSAVRELTEIEDFSAKPAPDGNGGSRKPMAGTLVALDVRLLLKLLGWYGPEQETAVSELVSLCRETGCSVHYFDHTLVELQEIYDVSVSRLKAGELTVPGDFVTPEAARLFLGPTDLWDLSDELPKDLKHLGLELIEVPSEVENESLGLDLVKLDVSIKREMGDQTQAARIKDTASAAAIYRLRNAEKKSTLEKCDAIFVTDSSSLARAVHWFFKDHFEEVPGPGRNIVQLCMTDIVFSTRLWTKVPTAKISVPRNQVIAHAIGNLVPTAAVLEKFSEVLGALIADGEMSEADVLEVKISRLTQRLLAEKQFTRDDINKESAKALIMEITAEKERALTAARKKGEVKAGEGFAKILAKKEDQIRGLSREQRAVIDGAKAQISEAEDGARRLTDAIEKLSYYIVGFLIFFLTALSAAYFTEAVWIWASVALASFLTLHLSGAQRWLASHLRDLVIANEKGVKD